MAKRAVKTIKDRLGRVNVQVSIFSAIIIVFSCALIFWVSRAAFMNVVESAYRAKTDIIFDIIEPHLDPKVYNDFNDEWALQTETYNSVRSYLDMVKDNYEIDNIFLAKLNENRKPVYVMDVQKTYEKCHVPNSEIAGNMANDVVLSFSAQGLPKGEFYKLEDGREYIRVYQLKNARSTPDAVVCIGISAREVYNSSWLIMVLVGLIVILCIVITVIFSNKVFKKISNPIYQDASNTDSLTGLKNKNSFTVDFHNIENQGRQDRYSIIVIDLNGLKTINDTRGHHIGDKYIQDSAAILKKSVFSRNQAVYRIGGDEFVIIMQDASYADINKVIANIEENTKKANEVGGSIQISMAVGHAMFESSVDRNFSNTFQRADTMMYNLKHEYYQKKLEAQKKNIEENDAKNHQ